MLIDQAQICLKAGDGGSGIISFRREKYVPKGGPDGGDGGRGGDIYLKTDAALNTLLLFRHKKRFKALSGRPGSGANKTGKSGKDLYVSVPPGTIIKDAITGEIIADLIASNQVLLAARGGIGGRGNARFATSTNRAPRIFEPGRSGEEVTLDLELKFLADVGLVGLPNVGKSTLLSRISNARPKIADYPFTTLQPHLGIVSAGEFKSFVMADLPGLIAGAHQGKGLGLRFLKHIERTRVLVFLIDSLSPNPSADVETLERELHAYDPEILLRPRLLVKSRADLQNPDSLPDFQLDLAISSVTGEGLSDLINHLWSRLNKDGHGARASGVIRAEV